MNIKIALLSLVLAGVFTGCSSSGTSIAPTGPHSWQAIAGSSASQEALQALSFYPTTMTINAGDTVTWTYPAAGEPHTVTFPVLGQRPQPGPPNPQPIGGTTYDGTAPVSSGFIMGGKTYSLTFPKPGTYAYYCEVHPNVMLGSVVVQAAGAADPFSQVAYNAQAQTGINADLALGAGSILAFPYLSGGTHLAAGIAPGLAAGTPSHATVLRFLDSATTASSISIPVGTTLTWTNQSNNEPHTVSLPVAGQQIPPGPPNAPPAGGSTYDGSSYTSSGVIPPGGSYSLTFTKAGTYQYNCLFHDNAGMVGTISVH